MKWKLNFPCVLLWQKEKMAGLELVDSRRDLRKVGVVKKAKKDEKPKRSQKGNKNRCKLCEELGHRVGSPVYRYTPERTKYVFLLLLFCCFFHLLTK
jgi:hypothetical protein